MQSSPAELQRPAQPALGLREGIADPAAGGCGRWPEHLRILNASTGELVRGKCGATNLCDYCARRAAVETTEMLWLDACEQGSPALWLLLTTSEAVWDGERFRRALEAVWRAVRLRWPDAEYAGLVEFTTGYGPRSGGRRRPHWNLFVRGVPVEDERAFRELVARVWCSRVKASTRQQRVTRVAEDRGGMRGLTRYVALHFLKESQAPPKGWHGQRFRATRGYFTRSRQELRAEARRAGRLRMLLDGGVAPELAELELELLEAESWELVHVAGGGGRDPDVVRREQARAPFRRRIELEARSRREGGDRDGTKHAPTRRGAPAS